MTLLAANVMVGFQTESTLRRYARADVRWSVIAAGKTSVAMSGAAARALGPAIDRMLVVAPDRVKLPPKSKRAYYMHAAHPLPDLRSVRAADLALKIAEETTDHLLVLISGGASSLLAKPAKGISLEKKSEIIEVMLRAGAPIRDINCVRRHLSAVKGGALFRAASGARFVLTLIVSDVLDDAPWDIGSGPTSWDPTTKTDARRILRALGAVGAGVPLVTTMKRGYEGPDTGRGAIEIVGSPRCFAADVTSHLIRNGYHASLLEPSDAPVETLANEYMHIAHKLGAGEAVVRAAEPSVEVPEQHGKGGRSTHLAALVGNALPAGVAFLAAATDGVDGSSGTAGAIVTRDTFANTPKKSLDRAIAAFATGPLIRRVGGAIQTKRVQNFADVHVLARAPTST